MTNPTSLVLDPSLLEPNPWNTNILTPENEAKLEESIKRLGFFRPAIVREIAGSPIRYQILGGEHRVQVAQKLGLKVPVVNLGPIDDLKAKEIGIADNARYGVDDTLAFAELIKGMGNADQLKDFLPYTENDFSDLFATADIDLDDLEFEENFENSEEKDEDVQESAAKPVKTHTIIRFKLSLMDAESVTRLIEQTKKTQGFTGSDELTNAGDALAHLLLHAGQGGSTTSSELDDVDDLLEDVE